MTQARATAIPVLMSAALLMAGCAIVVLLDPRGGVVAREGHGVQLDQTRRNEATGTWDDPYIADGLTLGGCYSYAR